MLPYVEHVLQVGQLVVEIRCRVLWEQVTLAACIANHPLVHHHMSVNPRGVATGSLVADHPVLVVFSDEAAHLDRQCVANRREKIERHCRAFDIRTILEDRHHFAVVHFKWTADHIVRLTRPALEGKLLAVVVQIHGALKHRL